MSPLATSIALIAGAYLIGSLSGNALLGRIKGLDARMPEADDEAGSALRRGGWQFALAVAIFDLAKAAFAVWLGLTYSYQGQALTVSGHGYACGLAAMLGHLWPLWHRLRGERNGAALLGALLILWPWVLAVLVVVWLAVLLATGYVALASVLAACALPLWAWFTDADPPRLWFSLAAAALVLVAHAGELRRVRSGNAPRFARARMLHWLYRRGPR